MPTPGVGGDRLGMLYNLLTEKKTTAREDKMKEIANKIETGAATPDETAVYQQWLGGDKEVDAVQGAINRHLSGRGTKDDERVFEAKISNLRSPEEMIKIREALADVQKLRADVAQQRLTTVEQPKAAADIQRGFETELGKIHSEFIREQSTQYFKPGSVEETTFKGKYRTRVQALFDQAISSEKDPGKKAQLETRKKQEMSLYNPPLAGQGPRY